MISIRTLFLVTTQIIFSIVLAQETDINLGPDINSRKKIEVEFIKILNQHREKSGLQKLEIDSVLAPMCFQVAVYIRKTHNLSHDQKEDVAFFDEMETPGHRYNELVGYDEYYYTHEVLHSGLSQFDGRTVFDLANFSVEAFKSSYSHWNALMDKDADHIFVYYDTYHNDPGDNYAALTCIVIIGKKR